MEEILVGFRVISIIFFLLLGGSLLCPQHNYTKRSCILDDSIGDIYIFSTDYNTGHRGIGFSLYLYTVCRFFFVFYYYWGL